jgi:hypothetical protein
MVKVDIKDWSSPVAKQYNLRSIPYFIIYGLDGKVAHTGQEAIAYLQRLEKKAEKLTK